MAPPEVKFELTARLLVQCGLAYAVFTSMIYMSVIESITHRKNELTWPMFYTFIGSAVIAVLITIFGNHKKDEEDLTRDVPPGAYKVDVDCRSTLANVKSRGVLRIANGRLEFKGEDFSFTLYTSDIVKARLEMDRIFVRLSRLKPLPGQRVVLKPAFNDRKAILAEIRCMAPASGASIFPPLASPKPILPARTVKNAFAFTSIVAIAILFPFSVMRECWTGEAMTMAERPAFVAKAFLFAFAMAFSYLWEAATGSWRARKKLERMELAASGPLQLT